MHFSFALSEMHTHFHTQSPLCFSSCLPFPPWITFLNSAGPAVGNNIIHYKCRIIPSCARFPHLRKFIPLQQKSQLERFQLPPILSSPFHQLHQQEYLWGCSVCAYSAAPSSCDVLAFRCWRVGRSAGVGTPQASVATKDNTMRNCGLIACQQTFHWVETWVRMSGSGQLSGHWA